MSNAPCRSDSRSSAALLLAICLALTGSLSGCITLSMWAQDDEDVVVNEEGTAYSIESSSSSLEDEPGKSRTFKDYLLLVALTPITLALDCITWPIQEFFMDPFGTKERRREREEETARPMGC